jgi:hypothetical protein
VVSSLLSPQRAELKTNRVKARKGQGEKGKRLTFLAFLAFPACPELVEGLFSPIDALRYAVQLVQYDVCKDPGRLSTVESQLQ